MSLQRRLLLYLLVCAPLVWAVAAAVSVNRARHQVNELFDTELIRLARQTQVTLWASPPDLRPTPDALVQLQPPLLQPQPQPQPQPKSAVGTGNPAWGEADVSDLAIAVWDARGRVLVADREGAALPYLPQAAGFVDQRLDTKPWRIYYLQSSHGGWLVAAGQMADEREELVREIIASQALPWLLVLPMLGVAMTWAVRQALSPLHQLSAEIGARRAEDLRPIKARPDAPAPAELQPLLAAMNGLFARIDDMVARERRFTADAAHELRTPLAVLRAQFDVLSAASSADERQRAEQRLGAGMARLERLVTQLLMLSRLEAGDSLPHPQAVDWTHIVEQAMSEVLPLAARRHIELACDWPEADRSGVAAAPLPLQGDAHLLGVLLRNLLDNAVRYALEGSTVTLGFSAERMTLDNDGEPLSAAERARLGERFYRAAGQAEVGSGLGISIVRRIAQLHGLRVEFGDRSAGHGMRVVLTRI